MLKKGELAASMSKCVRSDLRPEASQPRAKSGQGARVLCYGEIDLDIYLSVSRLPALNRAAHVTREFENVGGAAANTAIWLANWGIPTLLAGHDLGEDRYGQSVRRALAGYPQLDTRYITWHPDYQTPRCQCLVTPDGERSFIMHWLDELRVRSLNAAMLNGVEWLNLDMSGPLGPRLDAARLAKSQNVAVLINDIYDVRHPILPLVDILVISASIVRTKLPHASPLELGKRLQSAAGCSVLITDGGEVLTALLATGETCQLAPPAVEALDTTGAGDIFKAGLLAALLAGRPLNEAIRWGLVAGTLAVTYAGTTATVASWAAVQDLLATMP